MYDFNGLKAGVTLSNGVSLPCVGYGTWRSPDSELTADCVAEALQVGYRHIDGAAVYRNETRVGEGIRRSGVKREDIFVTSKLWNTCRRYDKALAAFDDTLADLGLDYLDLYLIHWPAGRNVYADWEEQNAEAWRALEKLYRDGRVRAIGVSNFTPFYLERLARTAEIPPMVNQIRYHVGNTAAETVAYCRAHDIAVEAYSPLGVGKLINDPEIVQLAEKYGAKPAQVALRFCLQNGIVPLPKSVTPARIRENADLFGFALSEADMRALSLRADGTGPDVDNACPETRNFTKRDKPVLD